MQARCPRVAFLASGDRAARLADWMGGQGCDLVLVDTSGERVREFPPLDLGISFLYAHRIPDAQVMDPYRWVNLHPAPLPEYRGRNVAYQAIADGVEEFGATLHYMDASFDTGEIIEVVRFPVADGDTAGDLVERAHTACEDLLRRWLPRLLGGRVPSSPQGAGRYFPRTRIDDRLSISADQARRIRALTAHPRFHAIIEIGGRRYRVVPEDATLANGFSTRTHVAIESLADGAVDDASEE